MTHFAISKQFTYLQPLIHLLNFDIGMVTSLEIDRTDRFWVETNLKISLSFRLVIFFGRLERDFVSKLSPFDRTL